MKVRIVPSAIGVSEDVQYLTSYVINGSVAVDAGSLGIYGGPKEQRRIKHIFLTHAHIDHVGSLPVLAENTYENPHYGVRVLGTAETLQTVKDHIFNDKIWPSFFLAPLDKGGNLTLHAVEPENPIRINNLTFTAVPVEHSVPTCAYIVDDESSSIVIGSDSGPTERVWEIAGGRPHLKAVFLESSFPDDMNELAVRSGHLTPSLLEREAKKLSADVRIIVTHIKPNFRRRIIEELHNLNLPRLEIGCSHEEYLFE